MKLFSHYMERQTRMSGEIVNWRNHVVGDRLSYSYRDTEYTRSSYPSSLHYHDYFELVIFEEGDIRYICEGKVYHPKYGDIILIPPGRFHMSAINCDSTVYRRHVFYLYPSAFDSIGHGALTSFLCGVEDGDIGSLGDTETSRQLMGLLDELKEIYGKEGSPLEEALGLSCIIKVFYLLNRGGCRSNSDNCSLPESILELKQYIDRNYADISSVTQVAEHFFYSREYVSRLFKKHFDTTISDYIMNRRIAASQELIVRGCRLVDIAYQVGFGSLSTFIRAFRSVTGMTPSEYRKLRAEGK